MYTIVIRRRVNSDRQQETLERARNEFFPKVQSAPGFIGFYLVRDEGEGVNCAVSVWQDKASADAFWPEAQKWQNTLDQMGNTLESMNRGETLVSVEPQR